MAKIKMENLCFSSGYVIVICGTPSLLCSGMYDTFYLQHWLSVMFVLIVTDWYQGLHMFPIVYGLWSHIRCREHRHTVAHWEGNVPSVKPKCSSFSLLNFPYTLYITVWCSLCVRRCSLLLSHIFVILSFLATEGHCDEHSRAQYKAGNAAAGTWQV